MLQEPVQTIPGDEPGVASRYSSAAPVPASPDFHPATPSTTPAAPPTTSKDQRPQLPPDVSEFFLNVDHRPPTVYKPCLLARASVRITDRTSGVNQDERYTYLVSLDRLMRTPDFAQAQPSSNFDVNSIEREPLPNATFEPLPSGINGRWMRQAERLLIEHVYRYGVQRIWFNRTLKLYGQPGESQLEFRQRCEQAAREKRDIEALKLRGQYERRMATVQNRIAREHRELTQDQAELGARKREELLAGVESVFNFIVGRRQSYAVAFGARRRRETESAQQDVRESEEAIRKLDADLQAIAEDYKAALSTLSDKWMRALADVQEIPLAPKKSDIFADLVALAWMPTNSTSQNE